MKKRGIIIGLTMVLLMSGCTGKLQSTSTPEDGSLMTVSEKTLNSEPDPSLPADSGEQVVEGAYVYSFKCGYLSGNHVPEQYTMYLITNEEEIDYAETHLGMGVPENEEELYRFDRDLADEFQKMKEAYPISDYNYLLYYTEYSQGGHSHHADSVVYDGDRIYFHYDKQISPEGEVGTDVMDGDFDMAAIPKTFFEGKEFANTTRCGSVAE